jgi:glycosyltransferase involved in cell wall biosynthesis
VKVLLIRCCRMPVFERAIAEVRRRYPDATIHGLTDPTFVAAVAASGVDHVVAWTGRFSLAWLRPVRFRRLRRLHFDLVVIPYMGGDDYGYANVQRFAYALGADRYLPLPSGRPGVELSRPLFREVVIANSLKDSLRAVDVPLMLLTLAFAALRRKRRPPTQGPGRLRVLHIITSLGAGGAQLQLAELIAHTPPDRYDLHVLVLNRDDGDFSLQRFPPGVRLRYVAHWPCFTTSIREVYRQCRQERYDIVHTWLFYANFLGAAGARLAGHAYIVGSVRNLSLWKRAWNTRWWYRVADALGSRIADVVTVNGTGLIADHARWAFYPAGRIRVVPNGLEPSRLLRAADGAREWLREVIGIDDGTPVVGTVGRLAPEKDQETFLRILAGVAAAGMALRGVVVGGGDLRNTLEMRARDLGLGSRVTFLGERSDARRLIAGLDAFVLPSRCEGFPNALLEAAMLGVPALATDVGAARDILGADDVADPGDVDGLARRLLEKLQDPRGAARRARETQQRALRLFTGERSAARWFHVYDGAASSRDASAWQLSPVPAALEETKG